MTRLRDQVVIVTGGGQGIGRAYCEGLAKEDAKVIVADISAESAEAVAGELEKQGTEALAIPVDISSPQATEQLAQKVLERFGKIDALINNAAVFQRPAVSRLPIEEIPIDEWDRVMAVNLRGMFLVCRAVVPQMKKQRAGRIVNISSTTVFHGAPGLSHYATSKAGVIGFTRSLARELGDFNITVNAIAPGLTLSLDPDEAHLQRQEQIAQMRILKKVQTPDDLVGTVIFLCSAESAFITGQTIVVDGGMYLS